MKTCRLLAASIAALSLCVATSAFAEDPPSENGDNVYDGKIPAVSKRVTHKSARDNVYMAPAKIDRYGRQSVIASVDQDELTKKQIDVTFSESSN